MADDPKLKIQIETKADLKAAEEAKRSLEGITESAEQAAPKIEAVTDAAQQSAPALEETAAAAEQTTEKLEDASAATEELSEEMQTLRARAQAALEEIERQESGSTNWAKATAEAASATKKTAGTLDELKNAGGTATMILRGLEQASRGGIGALFGLSQAIRGVITAVTRGLGPVGLLVTGLGLLGGAYLALRDKLRPAAQATEDFEKKSAAAKKAADDLAKTKADALVTQWERAAEAADRYRVAVEAVRTVEDARTDADEAIALAKVRANQSLTAVQRLEQEQTIRREARQRRAGTAASAEDPRVSSADAELTKSQQQIEGATEEVARRAAVLARTRATPAGLAGRVATAEERARAARAISDDASTREARDRAQPALEAAETELANARAAQAASAKTFAERLKAREEELQAAVDALAAAYRAQETAVSKLGSAAITVNAEEKARLARERATNTVEAIDLDAAKSEDDASVGLAKGKGPAVDTALDEFFRPLDASSRSFGSGAPAGRNILQRGGGALPGDRQEVDIRPLQESFDKGAESLRELEVPPIDPTPMQAAVNQVNARLQKEVGGLAKETADTFREVSVVLDVHKRELESLRYFIRSKA